jgi:hypothetical protein
MTAIAITGMNLTGVLRITWVHDNLAHVEDHSQIDETSGPQVLAVSTASFSASAGSAGCPGRRQARCRGAR